jgi:hypothetical protein
MILFITTAVKTSKPPINLQLLDSFLAGVQVVICVGESIDEAYSI